MLKSKTVDENWTMIIRPQRRWLDLRLGDLWQARELVTLFVWRDFFGLQADDSGAAVVLALAVEE